MTGRCWHAAALASFALLVALALTSCRSTPFHAAPRPVATSTRRSPTTPRASATDAAAGAVALDTLFQSPSRLYSIRYNHAWAVRQLPAQSGTLDYFALPNANLAISITPLPLGTSVETYTSQMLNLYQELHLQGLARAGTIAVGGGIGELLRAVTYVNPQGATVATPPAPGAAPQNFVQALYVVAGHGFSFSIAWPASDTTDELALLRRILRTFTLAGAS